MNEGVPDLGLHESDTDVDGDIGMEVEWGTTVLKYLFHPQSSSVKSSLKLHFHYSQLIGRR